MFSIKKILFPVDFSEPCIEASRYVAAVAHRFQADITLLHVVDTAAYRAWSTSVYVGMSGVDMGEQELRWAREKMSRFLIEPFQRLDVKREIVEGEAGSQIVAAARRSGADLIMMPTHGLGVFRRYILGSITAKVLHDAECPVWTGTHLNLAPALEQVEFPKILCAVDMGPQSEKALRWASGFATEHRAELLAVHIVPATTTVPGRFFDQHFVAIRSAEIREELGALLDALKIQARIIVIGGDPAQGVSEIAQNEKVSQLVIARGAVAGGLGRLRAQAYTMIRTAPCPVVSV